MIVCRKCFNESDPKLKICPHCGSKKKKFRFKDFLKSCCYIYDISCVFFVKTFKFKTIKVLSWRYLGLSPSKRDLEKITKHPFCKREYVLGLKAIERISLSPEEKLKVEKMIEKNPVHSGFYSSLIQNQHNNKTITHFFKNNNLLLDSEKVS